MEKKLKSKIVGGHTIYSEWPLVGGEASGFVEKNKIISKQGVKLGDQLILTKPIGIQAIMASYRILKDMPELIAHYSKSELNEAIDIAIKVMTTPNQNVVKTIHSYKDFHFIHAMTDITGFGLAGHAKEMLQSSNLSININRIPYIKLAENLSKELGYASNECKCHETAGGMLLSVANEYTEEFSDALKKCKVDNWIVGSIVKEQPGQVRIDNNAEHIEILKF
jgi:selenide,water dikinase